MQKSSLLAFALLAMLAAAAFAFTQQIHLPPAVSQSQGMGSPPVTSADSVQQQQARAAFEQRQLEIRRDTEKMFQLTGELRQSLSSEKQNTMSVDDLKKVEQIEKLAHGVRSKMKQSM